MLIAIDETGSPAVSSDRLAFFVAVHLRQRKTMHRMKQYAFEQWEASLPASLKNHNGEIKGKQLGEEELVRFAKQVIVPHPAILVTTVGLRPSANSAEVVEKHRAVQAEGIRQGAMFYREHDNHRMARTYEEFLHWFRKLSYDQYLKVVLLGKCIARSLVNAFGHSIAGGYEDELMRLRYVIDRDFVREERSNAFWHELLRNQIWYSSKENPLPLLDTWKSGHPVLQRYSKDGRLNFNELFWKNPRLLGHMSVLR